MQIFLKNMLVAVILMLLLSCSKDDAADTPETPTAPVLKENVKIIDATKFQLDLTQSQIDNGIYQFTFSGTAPNIAIGSIIIGEQGEGFIRKVTTSVVDGNTITLQTTQGTMSDVFQEGGFNFNLDMINMQAKTKGSSGFSFTITNQTIYHEGALSFVLNNGQIDFDPNWFLDFNFDKKGISSFEISAKKGTLNGNLTATVTASQATTLINKSSSILKGVKPYKKTYTKWVPATLLGLPVLVPITVVMELDLVLDYSATISASISRQATFASNSTFNLGLNYTNGKWNDINSFTPTNEFTLSQRTGNANATINLALTPKVSFKLYGQAGPYASISLMEQLSGSAASPALDWDFKADVWLKSTAGASVSILDHSLADYSKSWETDKLSYFTPYKIEKVSGDNQTGTFGNQLTTPLKIRIIDNLDRIQSNVPVYFTVNSGGGTVQTTSILTDENGFAETQWTLGASDTQVVNVSAKNANGTALLNSPVSFSATVTTSLCGKVIDIDGNVYSSVKIGEQCWMQKNLNVSKYRNGDDIPHVQNAIEWEKLTTGAWCYYKHQTEFGAYWGKLYNWYAVHDSRGLAPVGYHIPTDTEWITLTTFLGGEDVAGGKMKDTATWSSSATNSSGFTGLPGSFYDHISALFNFFDYDTGNWWSSSESGTTKAWYRSVNSKTDDAIRGSMNKRQGLSVRCLMD